MSSSSESSGENGDDGVQNIFECVLCPGSSYTAAEKDLHRQFHKEQRAATRPGPASKRARQPRVPIPPGSLFVTKSQEVSPPVPEPGSGRRTAPSRTPKRKDKPSKPDKETSPKKRKTGKGKSTKTYKSSVDTSIKYPGA